jgi:hypothetical protein
MDDQREMTLTPELMDALVKYFELGVNVSPGEKQQVSFSPVYKYDYGRVDEPQPTPTP